MSLHTAQMGGKWWSQTGTWVHISDCALFTADRNLSVYMHPADGRQVVVTDGDLATIPAELRAEVHEKLLDLYNTVASVVPATAKRR